MIKKIICILIFIVIPANFASAKIREGYIEYNGFPYKFKSGDSKIFIKQANRNMALFEKSQNYDDKAFYLNEAMRYYFLCSKADIRSIDAQIGLGRVYDEMWRDDYAKKHFFTSVNMNPKNPAANFYFANFYFKRSEFITALHYYKKAYENGYSNKYEVNYLLGTTYEKLADIQSAQKFYEKALNLQPTNTELLDKIHLLDELNYSDSQYYLFSKSGERVRGK